MTTNFGQLITAMVSPFKEEDASQLDFAATEKLVEHLVKTGSDSIIISGTTGESPTLTHDEEVELFKVVQNKVQELGADTRLIFGAGSNSTQTSIRMSKQAEELGADGLLIVTPYYNKPSQKGMKAHFSSIAKATSLPIILYNVPSRTNVSLTAETIVELANEYPNIASLKEASSNIDIITAIRIHLGSDRFSIYSGDDSLTLPMMAVGADGIISVASHLVGLEMQEMMNEFKAGNLQKAQQIQQKLFPLFDSLFTEPNPTCIKEALGIIGLASSQLREPLVKLSAEQRANLEDIINSVVEKPSLV